MRQPLVLRRRPRAARNEGSEDGVFFLDLFVYSPWTAANTQWHLFEFLPVPFIRPALYTCKCKLWSICCS